MPSEIFDYLSSLKQIDRINLLDSLATDPQKEYEHFHITVHKEERNFDEYGGVLVRQLILKSTKSEETLYCTIDAIYAQNDYLGCNVAFTDESGNTYTLPSQ